MCRCCRDIVLIHSFAVAASMGCRHGNSPLRVVIMGTVNFQGEAVIDGQIRFIPQSNTLGPVSIEPIRGGRYRCDHAGGVPVGKHRVEILAWNPRAAEPIGPGLPPRPQFLPAKYNAHSELFVSIEKTSNPLVRDFNLN